MKIGVSGASGQLGQAVLRYLRARPEPHQVVGISRSAHSVTCADEVRTGDYNAPNDLEIAYDGLDRLLIIPTLDVRHGARARQLVAAIDAAGAAGVGHIVLISDVGTREEAEPNVGAASWVAEQHLIKSAPCWTILRANYFMESFAHEALLWLTIGRLVELGENWVGFVSRDDVAAAAAGILAGEGHVGAIYNATGPERLTTVARASLISEISGRPITVVETSREDLHRQFHLAGFPQEYFGIAEDTKIKTFAGGFDILTGDVARLAGRATVSLEQVLRAQFTQARSTTTMQPPTGESDFSSIR